MASIRRYKWYFDYLSGRAEYLFIHIPKNAGVAIKLSPMLQGRLVGVEPWFFKSKAYYRGLRQTMRENNEHHGIGHARVRDVHHRVRERLLPIAVIRNPWSRVVSRFRFAQGAMANGASPEDYASQSFEEFLEERHIYQEKEYYWHRAIRGWYPQADYVLNETGVVEPHILRHEHLGEEAQQYFGFQQEVRPRNVSPGQYQSYQDYYNEKTIQIVADWYQKDIELFDFDFDTPARKNCYFGSDSDPFNVQQNTSAA